MSHPSPSPSLQATFEAALQDSQIDAGTVGQMDSESQPEHVWAAFDSAQAAQAGLNPEALLSQTGDRGALFVLLENRETDPSLASLRNHLWPHFHAVAIYDGKGDRVKRRTVGSSEDLQKGSGGGQVYLLRRLQEVMSPETTTAKFDQNAKGWDGVPGSPGYPHFRWMRRYVGLYGKPDRASRILDFGSGAGWVGIEAAKCFPGSSLFLFDPSPEMVVQPCEGRVGFGDEPPFPRAGEEPYDWVISSGVISFAPDSEAWLDGLCRTLAPGGTLVIGDIQLESKGFRKRRKSHPLLPVRELNAKSASWVRKALEARGFQFLRGSAYQLTYPVPQVMHVNETKLGGVLSRPLLWLNQLGAGLSSWSGGKGQGCFDSWVMHLRAPGE
ncbi:MAG: class I SAM-dependent methyltransferase [Planctomycetota bacterium]|nr:class I SAM-dependent methyltransferase [Planctomycetota bacterium]